MRIADIHPIPGPNVYSHRPVLVMKLLLEDLSKRESLTIPGFNDRLLALLPGVHEHHCSKGYAGGFVVRLHEGTYFGHIIEHVALELTEWAGVPTFHGKTRHAGEPDHPDCYLVVIEYKAEKGTEYLLRTAVELVQALVNGEPFPLEERIEEAKRIIAHTELGPSTKAMVEAAARRNIPWQRLDEQSLVQFGYGKNRRLIAAAMTSATSAVAMDIASHKDLTKRLLDRAGLPVPLGQIARTAEEAVAVLDWLNKPVAVKPHNAQQGKGVSLNLYTAPQVSEAFQIARQYSPEVLVEELFVGRDYRVLVVGGRVIAASERIPARVIGDGQHTVAELIEIENRNPRRGDGHEFPLTKLRADDATRAFLRQSKLDFDHVPGAGENVFLRGCANLSTGGTARDVTDVVHSSVKRICERAAAVIGLDICGVDLVLPDISEPISKGGIIEVNAAPGLRMHLHPSEGQARDVGEAIIESLYPQGTNARIPIISVTGTNGKTTITRLIAHLLSVCDQAGGQTIGMTTTEGMYLNGELIVSGDTTGPRSAQVILSDPTVDVAVLEVARGGILRGGLAYDWSDISVLSNIQLDHVGQNGITTLEDLVYIKSVVAERVREGGTLILNADDEQLVKLAENPRVSKVPKKIVYYSLKPSNPVVRRHIAQGGVAFCLLNGWLTEMTSFEQRSLVDASALPMTLGGKSEYQISNALAALAAARAYGLRQEQIAPALLSYQNCEHNSGRSNFYRVGKGYVMVDYGHNPAAFTAVGRVVRRLGGRRVTAVLGVPGDRDDSVIRQAAQAAARSFGRLIIKEDHDLRGRGCGEVAQLLYQAAVETAREIECRVILDEKEALESAIREMRDREIVVVFFEKFDGVMDVLKRHAAVPITNAAEMPTAHGLRTRHAQAA
jgi:cyanophycin synthetase